METFLIKALQLILSLSILVIVHEFGHFMFARLFKIRVEKFYLFFNPGFSLFKFKPKNSETEYGIGWLPLGGYVKISGMIDESMDKEQMQQPPQPWEFRSKPAWQRLLVMVGGVTFNVLLAIFIYSMIMFSWGDSYVSFKDIKHGMEFSDVAKSAGFQDGDKIISADGKELKMRMDKTLDMNTYMSFAEAKTVVVERGGEQKEISLPDDFSDKLIASKKLGYMPKMPAVIDSVVTGSNAQKCGLRKGDSIVTLNGKDVISFAHMRTMVGENAGKNIKLEYYRDDSCYETTAYVDSTGTLGFTAPFVSPSDFHHDNFGFFASIPAGLNLAKETLEGYIAQFRFVFTKEGASNLGGFGAIGGLFPATWDWQAFWFMTAFLSIILAVMNILPIPALDGGHVMFLLYEVVSRRKPNEKFMEYAQMVGMFLLFALLIYANGNDIYRFFFK
ncbi:regulator of sigma E protease [Dysgonomonas sp. PH5-45]|uniref:RIP metalloprotease RseP n=1 Tax=unclassified Dysgonomonas TaxID=2630389 RepID=UPI002475C0EB|nr:MULTISPECIES: RIP metalloprotease RseP [unclassified Dysgonomonas]MDH6354339.1 regulator of sigma E protease [Dysgonomonas sp. PH5-45]MDH6387239.1 regulator of sigma E protease [Dysgonomonas sp. PH5-37]